MQRRDALRIFLGGILLAPVSSLAAGTGAPILDKFHAQYRSVRALSCTFRDGKSLTGTLLAQRGGRYRITLPDREIVSDGSSVWSATTSARTVIINTYNPSSNDLSLERVFFEIMNVYRSSIRESRRDGGAVIRLEAPRADAVIAGVTVADVNVDPSCIVKSITLTHNGSTQQFHIQKLQLTPRIRKTDFSYTPPLGWEIVDLR